MEHPSLMFGRFHSGRLTVNCSDPDPNATRLLRRLLESEERKEERLQETSREILLKYLNRLDETSHLNGDEVKTLQNEETQDAKNNNIRATPSAKTGEFSKCHNNIQPYRQNYNVPVKIYYPAGKSKSFSAGSFIDPIFSPPQLPDARVKDPSSPPYNPEMIALDTHHASSQVEKAGGSKGALDVHLRKNIESDMPKSPSGNAEDANEASPPRPFMMYDIQNDEDKAGPNVQIGHMFAANAATNVVAKGERDSVHHYPGLEHTSNASRDAKLSHAGPDVKLELTTIEDKTLGEILKDLPTDVLEPIILSTKAVKESSTPDDDASLNTRNDYWSISSIRSPPSNYEPNDTVDGVTIPPPLESPDDFTLPLDTLLKPIKKNTYSPVNQENVQKFLAGAQWHASPPIDQSKTLWMAKRHPLQPVGQPLGVFLASPAAREPTVPRQRDLFLDSIELSRRNSQQTDSTGPDQDGLRRSRLERYPGRETVYTEYMREDITEHTQQRVFIQKIRTQNTNPTDRYIRHLRHERAATEESVVTTPESRPVTHKECVICCDNRLLEEYPQALHMSGHEICKDCVARYLRIKILKEGMISIRCPAEDCVIVLDYDEIKRYCGVVAFAKYDELLCRKVYEEDPNFRWCTNRTCSTGQIIENGDTSSHFTCLTCQFKSCFHCRTPAHPDITCMQNWTNVRNQFFAADEPSGVWLRSYTKPCNCGRWIQKMEGCDHVKCPVRPVGCGGEWCWMCGAKYEEIRKVGNTAHRSDCPHYA